jgi:hypothetical protein
VERLPLRLKSAATESLTALSLPWNGRGLKEWSVPRLADREWSKADRDASTVAAL